MVHVLFFLGAYATFIAAVIENLSNLRKVSITLRVSIDAALFRKNTRHLACDSLLVIMRLKLHTDRRIMPICVQVIHHQKSNDENWRSSSSDVTANILSREVIN
jgi:hypothetical protein